MDNLDDIIAFGNAGTENQGQPWNPEQDQCLLELYQKDVSIKQIASTLKRNNSAVRARLKKLGIAL